MVYSLHDNSSLCVTVHEGKIGDLWVGDEGLYYDLEGRIDICIHYILVC